MRTHLINMDQAGVLDDDYDKFFNYRCRAIARELAKKLIPQQVDERGQGPNQDDFEDLETAQREGSDADARVERKNYPGQAIRVTLGLGIETLGAELGCVLL